MSRFSLARFWFLTFLVGISAILSWHVTVAVMLFGVIGALYDIRDSIKADHNIDIDITVPAKKDKI